ncbi:hypothetical protein [Bacteriovorax sp. Seq25_V]|uniref:hypothetical protein n=1 Tax=Bacteriovorax sp. Seq25_V TaxID=1201288 RepID=UPI00038A3467|nr:hypothetical protein [Bacteriovorax sp. Seq25_V]EQC44040.1 hypothetical protein M900_1280 [Bacteriovorax sp. Seq25_V]
MDTVFIEEILLETFSFYEWQNIEKVLISLNPQDLILIESITLDELKESIEVLIKRGQLESKKINGEIHYRRFQKRTWVQKIKSFFS